MCHRVIRALASALGILGSFFHMEAWAGEKLGPLSLSSMVLVWAGFGEKSPFLIPPPQNTSNCRGPKLSHYS